MKDVHLWEEETVKEEFVEANVAPEENSVKIMTVHKSKGLEFPVTILANARSGGRRKNSARITVSDTFGITMIYKDDTGLALVENPLLTIPETVTSQGKLVCSSLTGISSDCLQKDM